MKNATKTLVSAFGALMAAAGIEHGIGEVLQGNIAPGGIMFPSWPTSPFFRSLAGEPAMSIIPNLLFSGILTIMISLALVVWSTLFVQRKNGGLVMILLSIAMLLVGGGIFPPILTVIIGMVGTKIHSPLIWWRTHLSIGFRRFMAKLWSLSCIACFISWLTMLFGVSSLDYFFGVNSPSLILIFLCCAFGFLLLTILAGLACDSLLKEKTQMAS